MQSYVAPGRRTVKPFASLGPSRSCGGQQKGTYKTLRPAWMWGVKEFYICVKVYLTRQRHYEKDIKSAADKLRAPHPASLLTVKELTAVCDIYETGDEQLTDSDLGRS